MSAQEFLDSVNNPNTKKGYRYGLKKFVDWYGKSAEEILSLRKGDLTQRPKEHSIDFKNRAIRFQREIEKFHGYLIDQGYSINSARNLTLGVRQLFRFYQMPVIMRKGSKVTQTVLTTKNFPLTISHVRRMFKMANLKERTILSLAVDTGLRISDFLRIRKIDLPPLEGEEPPISFTLLTQKNKITAHCFLSQESVELLSTYLPTIQNKKNNDYLFPSNGESHISDEAVSKMLKKLAAKAQIDLNNKQLSFHCFRKLFLSSSIDSGIGLTAGKLLCGKAIPKSDGTYLTTVQLRDKFIQLKKFLAIEEQPKIETEKIESLKNAIVKLHEQLTEQKLITVTISEQNIKLKPLIEFIEGFESEEKLKRFLDLLKASSVITFPQHETTLVRWDCSDELKERIEAAAKETGMSEDDLIHAASKLYLKHLEKKHGIPSEETSRKKQKG